MAMHRASFNRRESNLTLDGDDDAGEIEIERIETPWMSRELFETLWVNATREVHSSCAFTTFSPRRTVDGNNTTDAATASSSTGFATRSSSNTSDDLDTDSDDAATDFQTQLLAALGDDIVVFPPPAAPSRSAPVTADSAHCSAFVLFAYASISGSYGLQTVLLVRLEQLLGSAQIAITIKNTDPIARTRLHAFLALVQQRLQPGAPPRRPQARTTATSAAAFVDQQQSPLQRTIATGPDTPPAPVAMPPRTTRARSRSHTVRYRSGAGISFEGYLNKKSDLLSTWRATYCVVEGDTMAFYETREDFMANTKLSGRIQLQRVDDDGDNDGRLGKPHGFRITTEGHRTIHLASRTAFEKDQWKRAITVAMTKAPEAERPPYVAFGSQPLDARKFYQLLGALLQQHVSEFPLLFQSVHPDVVVTSNFPPIVPFWGQYRRYDGVLLFISTLLETVDVEHFALLDVMELVRGDADCIDAFVEPDAITSANDSAVQPLPAAGASSSATTTARSYAASPQPESTSTQQQQQPPLSSSTLTPTPAWTKRLVVTGKETFHLLNHDGRRITQLFVHELWLDHKHRLVRWHMNGDAVALSVAFDDAARGENIRLVLPGEASAISHSIPPGTFYVQVARALQLHPLEQPSGASSSSSNTNGKRAFPVYVRCILEEGTHQERTLDGLEMAHRTNGGATTTTTASDARRASARASVQTDKRRVSTSTRLFRGFKRATGISGERSFAPFGDPSGCVTHICKAVRDVGSSGDATTTLGGGGGLNPQWSSNLRLAFPGCARGFTYYLKLEVFQSRFMLPDEVIGVCKINLTPHLSLFNGSADAKANGALLRWHNLCDQYNDCKESWAPPTVFRGRLQVGVIFAPTIASAASLNDPKIQGKRQSVAGRTSNVTRENAHAALRRFSSDETLLQSLSADSLRAFMRSNVAPGERHSTAGHDLIVHAASSPSLSTARTLSSSLSRRSVSSADVFAVANPQESELEAQRQRLARDNHVFAGKKTVFDVPRKFRLIKVVGAGTYGEVIAASDVASGSTVAIKKITNAFVELADTKRLLRELCLLRQLSHPNVIQLVDVLRPERLAYLEDIYLVTDLMETDLHRVIHSTQTLTDAHVAHFLRQILRALAYLHSANVLHRDLKPSNVLVTSACDVKVCDLGLARYVDYAQATTTHASGNKNSNNSNDTPEPFVALTEYVVTRWYRAPEILLDGCRYDKPSDVWSAGCILAELLGRKPLFPGSSTTNQLSKILDVLGTPPSTFTAHVWNAPAQKWLMRQRRRPTIPFRALYPSANTDALDLLEKLLVMDPRKRLTAAEALRHPYLMEAFRSSVAERDGDGNAQSTNAMLYDAREEAEDTFVGGIDDSHERVAATKQAMQEAVFEQVCHFNPDARAYEHVVAQLDQEFTVDAVSGKLVPVTK